MQTLFSLAALNGSPSSFFSPKKKLPSHKHENLADSLFRSIRVSFVNRDGPPPTKQQPTPPQNTIKKRTLLPNKGGGTDQKKTETKTNKTPPQTPPTTQASNIRQYKPFFTTPSLCSQAGEDRLLVESSISIVIRHPFFFRKRPSPFHGGRVAFTIAPPVTFCVWYGRVKRFPSLRISADALFTSLSFLPRPSGDPSATGA